MYRGLARLVGMDVPPAPASMGELPVAVGAHLEGHDFVFTHVKYTDKAGEDGDFERKRQVIEDVDAMLPEFLSHHFDVVVVTGDHSTPAALKSHSWHELPLLLSSDNIVVDNCTSFGERACMAGGLGHIRHVDIMPLAMAHADKLTKYGA
jgi:2,3-bisphosphoglycerate-independent phosphoglycerate mutase